MVGDCHKNTELKRYIKWDGSGEALLNIYTFLSGYTVSFVAYGGLKINVSEQVSLELPIGGYVVSGDQNDGGVVVFPNSETFLQSYTPYTQIIESKL